MSLVKWARAGKSSDLTSLLSTNQKFRRRTMALYASKGYATPGGGGDGMGSFEEAENLSAYYNDDVREKDEICARDEGWRGG